jgi:DNA-binding LacI/PurR family transcriptional regulator
MNSISGKVEVTIADVAKAAGVSVSTVSRILNNKPDVSESTRQRVLQIITELGFEPHAQARRLAAGESRTIALLDPVNRSTGQPQQINQLHLDFMIGAATAAGQANYFFNVITNPTAEDKLLTLYRGMQVDGIILMEIYLDDPRVELLRKYDLPFVMIGRCADNAGLAFVELDFDGATRMAFDHLVALGHSKIGFLGFPAQLRKHGFGPAVRAWAGYKAALEQHGLEPIYRETIYRAGEMSEAAFSLLEEQPGLTAIVAMTDAAIVGVLNALRQRARSIPNDFSVVGLAIDRLAELITPGLTAIRFPSYEMGFEAATMLIQKLKGAPIANEQHLIPLELVVRGSTGPART